VGDAPSTVTTTALLAVRSVRFPHAHA
jgi:hypothetical protein